jgi:hypothetical protein
MKAEEFEQLLRAQATPIDFDHLIRTDIIEKHGARYKILKMSELPSCVLNQAKEAKQDKDGKTLLKFPASNKRAKKLLRDFEARKRS